ncbi:helix-turn-helix transcriptional regulator [Pararhodobacter sp. SW119]|uniref:helix-turn-helix transcriptional regulator n=1 Tax=Pararhodobacter sp. SW119 TaxID=2780075 RepID=UPI001ADFF6CD|nr:helix-turn-helix transcriptional regulator [Pararhodobacter sp. SW119]
MDGLDLHALADTVAGAATPEAAWQAFHAALARQGLARAALHLDLPRRAANPFAPHPGAQAFGTVWDGDLDARLRGYRGDVRRASEPTLWHLRPTLKFLSLSAGPLYVDHRRLLERPTVFAPISRIMLEELGQHQALSIPLAAPAAPRMSMLTFWGDDPAPDFGQFARAQLPVLQMAGLYFAGLLALRWPSAPHDADAAKLSSRERQVLTRLAEGVRIAGIANELRISERSAQEYVARARLKLGARTRTDAVIRALLAGLIDPRRPG